MLQAWLETTLPDVVGLQELKTETDRFPRAGLEAIGYGALVVGRKAWNGVALLARDAQPIEIRRRLPGDPNDREARYPQYTFWDYRRRRWERDAGLRIDPLLVSEALMPRLVAAGVEPLTAWHARAGRSRAGVDRAGG